MSGLFLLGATQSDAQFPLHKKKKINKSTAAENTAEPDKVLYYRAMDDIKHGRHEVGRLNLQTLINTYPDSEYLAKAKLAIADSFYKEGGTSNLTQAVQSYKDFDIFFPMLPEAAYAQLQVAMTHYKQLEKPDRDRTQALAAEDEFQTFLAKYPNDPLVPKAEQHLREVQEILAEGDFRIGTYYYLKQPPDKKAAESRLKAVVNRYPLYSKSDQALWMLGNIWQSTEKKEFAVPYYARIVRNYPLSPLVPEAKKRLTALGAPIPQPDPEAVAWMTAEQKAPRPREALYKKPMALIHNGPTQELRMASTTGKPNMTPQSESEGDILTGGNQSQIGSSGTGIVATVTPGSNGGTASGESVTPATEATDANTAAQPDPNAAPAKESSSSTTTPVTTDATPKTDAPAATANQPAADATKTDAAPATGQATDAAKTDGSTAQTGAQNGNDDSKKESSSKKKKGLKKLIPW
jgi:outer membrane protein assembly factor BamD